MFSAILKILSLASPDQQEKMHYSSDYKEVIRCTKRFDGSIFVDLLMSILIRNKKVHRTIVFYAFNAMISMIGAVDAGHIIRASFWSSLLISAYSLIFLKIFIFKMIGKSDKEIAGEDEEKSDDEDFKPITETELEALKQRKTNEIGGQKKDSGGEGESSEEEDSDSDSEEEEEMEVNPKLARDVRKALGKAAFLDEHDDEEDMVV